MNSTGIRLLYMISPFCVSGAFKGFLNGYTYLRFVKYTGLMGYIIISFYLMLGISGMYLYFWLIWIESKKMIKIVEIIKIVIKSSFFYFFIIMMLFEYISNRIYHFDGITYFSTTVILLLLCLYGQMQLEEKFLRLMEERGVKRE